MLTVTVGCGGEPDQPAAESSDALVNGIPYPDSGSVPDPNLVGIFRSTPETGFGNVICSGVALGSDGAHVLTAAHCVVEAQRYGVFKGNIDDGRRDPTTEQYINTSANEVIFLNQNLAG